MKTKMKTDAVKIDDRNARLELSYKTVDKLGNEDSDSVAFSCLFGGWSEKSSEDAKAECVDAATNWVNNLRFEGFEVGAWDELGNCY